MTKPEQRIAIAEACGWKRETKPCNGMAASIDYWTSPEGKYYGMHPIIPDYPNDLNAMHEAENWLFKGPLTDTLGMNYWNNLWMACGDEYKTLRSIGNATAAQRAEAFLRTVGKWRE